MRNWYVGSSTRGNPSERLLTSLTSTLQQSIRSQRRRLKCIFCSVTPGYPVSKAIDAVEKRAPTTETAGPRSSLNRTLGDWHRGHLLLHRRLLDSSIEQ